MYTKNPLKEQAKIIKKHFGITMNLPETVPLVPEGMEHWFLIPEWKKVAPTYNEAVQKVLDAIKSTRPFYNWREGQIGPEFLRERVNKGIVPEILAAQFGEKHKGESVENVRKTKEILLGAYEVGIMLLTHPNRLEKYEDLWIDCPGDEYNSPASDARFGHAPYFYFSDGVVKFGAERVGFARDLCGSASGFLSQVNIDPRTLDPLDSSGLDRAIEIVKEAGYVISKII